MGYLLLLPAIGFFYIYLTGIRKTGLEVFGGTIYVQSMDYYIYCFRTMP